MDWLFLSVKAAPNFQPNPILEVEEMAMNEQATAQNAPHGNHRDLRIIHRRAASMKQRSRYGC
ncbi:hypothetical protein [Streptomyces sp. NPDC098781]|uniref:hypothetical protein n=1 Tax=Streptomyces sp. NPDC098781 TaxID=3366097 RepID=UPI003822A271